ncbi:hypothetical protein TNCV_2044261 [Trichonephila clavipes]|nr:hypothetical protein TNCV_2044261 [Trichonephila clavipes]
MTGGHLAHCNDEFRGPRSDYFRQFYEEKYTLKQGKIVVNDADFGAKGFESLRRRGCLKVYDAYAAWTNKSGKMDDITKKVPHIWIEVMKGYLCKHLMLLREINYNCSARKQIEICVKYTLQYAEKDQTSLLVRRGQSEAEPPYSTTDSNAVPSSYQKLLSSQSKKGPSLGIDILI